MFVLENFKNILGRPPIGRQAQSVIFFFKFATKSLKKKKEGACRPPTGDRPLSPIGGRQTPLFFLQGLRYKFGEKNYTLGLSPYGRATGVYF